MNSEKPVEEDTRKLASLVIFMSVFVALLYGLGPLL